MSPDFTPGPGGEAHREELTDGRMTDYQRLPYGCEVAWDVAGDRQVRLRPCDDHEIEGGP